VDPKLWERRACTVAGRTLTRRNGRIYSRLRT
jgi:hypothetical protein